MKSFKSPQRVILIFLTLFIILCCFLIVRLEIKAANLKSRLDEHHKSLEDNKDILEYLDSFKRSVKNSGISVDKEKIILSKDKLKIELDDNNIKIIGPSKDIALGYDGIQNFIALFYKGAKVYVGEFEWSKNRGVFMQSMNEKNLIAIFDDQIIISAKDQDEISNIQVDSKSIYIKRGESYLKLNDDDLNIEVPGNINIISKNGNINIKGNKVKVNE